MADRFRGPRMPKHWHAIPLSVNTFVANGSFIGGVLALDGPFTVIRMIGEYIIGPTSAPAAGDKVELGIGIGVVSSDSAALGSTAMPDPIGEPGFPWLYQYAHNFHYPDTSLEDGAVRTLRKSFDIRSMRKIKPRESLVVVVEYSDLVGTPPMTMDVSRTRVLVAT